LINFQQSPPLSLYIHIPWCVRKCPYCDFNSHEARQAIPEAQYVDALIRDLEQSVPQVWGRRVHSIFFGGGTPSLFSVEAIDRILSNVRALLPLEYGAEITLEANPGTVEAAKFAGFRDAGVNRLSLGIQSFNDQHLQALGRIHDAREAHRAVELTLATFGNVNLDLMYALPGQTPQQALTDLRTALGYQPQHLSVYHLTIEPNTPFHRTPPPLPDDDTSAAMQEMLEQELAAHGYGHYETSAFATKGRRCRHNLNYWQFGDYLGIGAGAHGKLSFHDKVLRQARPKHPNAYLKAVEVGNGAEQEWEVTRQDIGFEFMMNTLRLTDGFPVALFQERTGLPISVVDTALNEAEKRSLLTRDHLEIEPTLQGQRFLNELLQLFLPA
jgi:putative oxygen-independent coproporphyrinogen III oxidase